MPGVNWGFALMDVDKRIGTAALHKIILRACKESGSHTFGRFKRTVELFNQEKQRKHGSEK
jgi:hypothetical protein